MMKYKRGRHKKRYNSSPPLFPASLLVPLLQPFVIEAERSEIEWPFMAYYLKVKYFNIGCQHFIPTQLKLPISCCENKFDISNDMAICSALKIIPRQITMHLMVGMIEGKNFQYAELRVMY